MKTSQAGIDLIKSFEGLRLKAYKALPTEIYYTIGYGHYGSDVIANMSITAEYAEKLLKADLAKFERAVVATGKAQTQNQFDALVSFAYNCGTDNLQKLVNRRTGDKIADAMLLYNKAGGKELSGLTRRRRAERQLFLTPDAKSDIKSVEDVAREVIDGKWGNGVERRTRLNEAGYNYAEIQAAVNRLLRR